MGQETVEIFFLKYKSPNIEARCLESIFKSTHWPYHLRVVDWRKGTRNMAATWNYLIQQHGHFHYKMFIDSDTVVTDGWLTYMMLLMNRCKDAGVVVPRTDNCGEARQLGLQFTDPAKQIPLKMAVC